MPVVIGGLLLALPAAPVAQISREAALALAYPGAGMTAERIYLTAAEERRVAELAGVEVTTALVARYVANQTGRAVGRAYLDTHVVRSKKESLLISLDAQGRVRRIDVTAFLEPAEYQASAAWLNQFAERTLGADLSLQRAIRPIAGATLTAQATTRAVRRVLAIDQVLQERQERTGR